MGKGKGTLARYCSRTFQNHSLFEFSGFNLHELFRLRKIFNKKVNIPIKIYSDFFINKHYKFNQNNFGNQSYFFFKKYRN